MGVLRALTMGILLLGIGGERRAAQAQTLTTLHAFAGGSDGSYPFADLIRDTKGNLYGTTEFGGASNQGTVFEVTAKGSYLVLYSFSGGADGAQPIAGLVRDKQGNLYGTTIHGGFGVGYSGFGVVFKLDKLGNYSVLYTFSGGSDGGDPETGLALDKQGNLYGTTFNGGDDGSGVIFKLDPSDNYSVLYAFTGDNVAGPSGPAGTPILDKQGNLYGTTQFGGNVDAGVVYKLDPAGNFTILHDFTGGMDGTHSRSALVRDKHGNLYGTALNSGAYGAGVVFKVDKAGNESVLYAFTGGSDGGNPLAGLVLDRHGNLYGTTEFGGTASGADGYGVVFKLDKAGNESVLYAFTGGSDGGYPLAGLVRDSKGNLYGTNSVGGAAPGANGFGTVFQITP